MTPRLLFALAVGLVCATRVHAEPLPPAVAQAMQQGYESWDPEVLAHAADVMETQLKRDPENHDLQRALAILYLDRLKAPEKAVPLLEKIAAEKPDDSAWQQAVARGLRASHQSEQAAIHYQKAADLQPGDAWVRYELANTLAGAGQYKPAITAYRAALAIDGKNNDFRLALAKTLWADGQVEEAKKTASAVLESDPQNPTARKLLAGAAESPATPPPSPAPPTSKPGQPLSAVDAAVADAYASGHRGKFVIAAELLESSLATQPRNLARRKTLAWIYFAKLHAAARAVPHLEKVVQATPRDGAWWQILAQAQAEAGNKEGAVIAYRRAADCSPREVWSRYHLGCTLRDLGRRPEAEAAFREALTIDPKNRYVRQELARCLQSEGRSREAAQLARELIREDAHDADAHALLGDYYRTNHDLVAAGTEYQSALATDPAHPVATTGIREIRKQERPEAKVAFYTFEDTDDLRQTGIFTNVSVLLNGRLRASAYANERFFKRAPNETVERFELGAGIDYQLHSGVHLVGGITDFKTENHGATVGGNAALYIQPASAVDFWVSYRSAEPVNDSYITAHDDFSQSILGAGINLRLVRNVSASFTVTKGDYSDGNTRRDALASVAWYLPLKTSPVVRLEYEWLDFEDHTSAYSSPDNYTLLRPVLEFSPRITDWLKLELHGELSYVFDEEDWGYGFTVGPRINLGESFNMGFIYMKYEIPGGQTTWSGEGFKVDLSYRF